MTAAQVMETLRDNAVKVDLDEPGEYVNQVNMAAMVATFIMAMPLDELARRSNDACGMSLIRFDDSTKELRRTREMMALFASTKRQLEKIIGRYGR